jgi:cbb3-type cytochrome c oxidase subunit III
MRTIARILGGSALVIGVATFVLVGHGPGPRSSNAAIAPMSSSFTHGQAVFVEYCAMCHGDNGVGDGELAAELRQRTGIPPANLTDRSRIARLGRAGVHRVIVLGGAHTGRSNMMPAWGERLDARQINDVADYVMHLPDAAPGISSTTLRAYLSTPPGVPEDGHRLFLHNCAACHGTDARGDGPLAAVLKAKHQIQPRNLTDSTYMAQKTDQQLFMTVTLGGGHMGKSPYMPAWAGYLEPAQIKSLVSYIRAVSHTAPQP